MTDRVHSLVVILDHDYRSDDVEVIKHAIQMIKGVIKVENNVADTTSLMAEVRAKYDLQGKILELFRSKD
jgi:hypothetical protein